MPKPPPTNAQQLVTLVGSALDSTALAGYSAPYLYDEAEKLCVDLLVEVRRLRAERDRALENKVRGELMDRDLGGDALEAGPMIDEAADTLN